MRIINFTGVVLTRRFADLNHDNAKALIQTVLQEADNNVLKIGNIKVSFYEDDAKPTFTKGIVEYNKYTRRRPDEWRPQL